MPKMKNACHKQNAYHFSIKHTRLISQLQWDSILHKSLVLFLNENVFPLKRNLKSNFSTLRYYSTQTIHDNYKKIIKNEEINNEKINKVIDISHSNEIINFIENESENEIKNDIDYENELDYENDTFNASTNSVHEQFDSLWMEKFSFNPSLFKKMEDLLFMTHPISEWRHISIADIKRIASLDAELHFMEKIWKIKTLRNQFESILTKYYKATTSQQQEKLNDMNQFKEQSDLKEFNDHQFNLDVLGNKKRSKQRWIFQYLKKIFNLDPSIEFSTNYFNEFSFPNSNLVLNYNKEESFSYLDDREKIQNQINYDEFDFKKHFKDKLLLQNIVLKIGLDIQIHIHFILSIKGKIVAVQYLNSSHFLDKYHDKPLEIVILKDQERRQFCQQLGIELIEVPYSWDGTIESLKEIIFSCMKFEKQSIDYHHQNTSNHFKIQSKSKEYVDKQISDLKEIEINEIIESNKIEYIDKFDRDNPLHVQKPGVWDRKLDVSNWWLSKKYDGVRAVCIHGKLFTKNGIPIPLPPLLQKEISSFNHLEFDGELVSPNGGYAQIVSLIKQGEIGIFSEEEWKDVKYMIFDLRIPNLTFEERQSILKRKLENFNGHSFVQQIIQIQLNSNSDLIQMIDALKPIEEGFVLVKPNSSYCAERVQHALKVKKLYDSEALFLKKIENGFRIRLPNGFEMNARVSEEEYDYPNYKPGETVFTIMYSQINQITGNPVKPMIYRERLDLDWNEVLKSLTSLTLHTNTNDNSNEEDTHYSKFMSLFLNAIENFDSLNTLKEKQELINRVVNESSDPFPYLHEIPSISDKLNLPETKIVSLLRRARSMKRNPHKLITEDKKSLINQLIDKYSIDILNSKAQNSKNKDSFNQELALLELKENLKEVGLNRHQISRKIYNFKHSNSGTITPTIKELIKNFLKENNYQHPTNEQKEKLLNNLNISSRQLSKQINLLIQNPGTITKESKQILINWVNTHKTMSLTKEDRDYILKSTGWNRHQLNKQLQILRDQPGELNDQVKKILSDWALNNNRYPTLEEKKTLQNETGLSHQQIIGQIRTLLSSGSSKISTESRNFVENWMKTFTINPTTEERNYLQQNTGLSRIQINNLINRIQNKQ